MGTRRYGCFTPRDVVDSLFGEQQDAVEGCQEMEFGTESILMQGPNLVFRPNARHKLLSLCLNTYSYS
jgi:hypothetical protein